MIDLPVSIADHVSPPSLSDLYHYPIRSNLSRFIEEAAHPVVFSLSMLSEGTVEYESLPSLRDLTVDGHSFTRVFWCRGVPYFYFLRTKEFTRAMTIHLQGPAARYLDAYADGQTCNCVCDSRDCKSVISFAEYRKRFAGSDAARSLNSFCQPQTKLDVASLGEDVKELKEIRKWNNAEKGNERLQEPEDVDDSSQVLGSLGLVSPETRKLIKEGLGAGPIDKDGGATPIFFVGRTCPERQPVHVALTNNSLVIVVAK